MIIATAGHVDHGKTELIKALTGTDTDRLPEEKRRGLSIELGFAYQPLADGTVLGFVDVPGHEKFIRNMLAGVGGIELGLLVVAADDGVMPQTREHTAILDLLGIKECVVVITKVDRVSESRVAEVEWQVSELLAPSAMAGAAVYRVCAPRGDGIDALREVLRARAAARPARLARGHFRLAVDRCFSLHGIGVVVTGTVFSGAASVGERLVVSPSGKEVRVRSIHAQNQESSWAVAGQRCALNLVGREVRGAAIRRGDWVLDPSMHAPTRRLDAEVRVLAAETRALKHWTPVHVHAGASHVTGRVAVLGGGSIAPGDVGLAQLVLDDDAALTHGDRLVLRDQSATRTIGGGQVIDPRAPKRGRARPARLAWLEAMSAPQPRDALERVLAVSPAGIGVKRFQQARNLTDAELDAVLEAGAVQLVGRVEGGVLIGAKSLRTLGDAVLAVIDRWHAERPQALGPNPGELQAALPDRPPADLVDHVLGELTSIGEVTRSGLITHRPGHRVRLDDHDARRWPEIRAVLEPADGSPPSLRPAAEVLELEPAALLGLLQRATGAGFVVPVTKNRFITLPLVARFADQAERLAQDSPAGEFSAAEFRDAAAVGRNFAIELLEFFDRSGFTQRIGDRRRLRRTASQVFGEAAKQVPEEEDRTPVGRSDFKSGEGRSTSLVGSTPTLFRQ